MNSRVKKYILLLMTENNLSIDYLLEMWEKITDYDLQYEYSKYKKEQYAEIKSQNPLKSRKEITSIIRENWNQMSLLKQFNYTLLIQKSQKKRSLYHQFAKDEYKKIKLKHPDWTFIQCIQYISQLWKQNTKLSSIDIDPNTLRIVEEYFQHGKFIEQNTIEDIRKMDPFLSQESKEEIDHICSFFEEKKIEKIRQLYEDNYNEILPDHVSKSTILEKIYNKERIERLNKC
jgi:hypothetical protein